MVRVLLGQMPLILREMFEHEIRRQPGLVLVHEHRPQLVTGHATPAPDVVIVGCDSVDDTETPLAFITRWPKARVMVVTQSEGEAALCELRLHTIRLGRVSPAEVVATARLATGTIGRI